MKIDPIKAVLRRIELGARRLNRERSYLLLIQLRDIAEALGKENNS